MKGPAIFLAQFADDKPPFNDLKTIAEWAASLGFKGVQIPTWDARLFDLKRAAESKGYCDEVAGICAEAGVAITELSTRCNQSDGSIQRRRDQGRLSTSAQVANSDPCKHALQEVR
jgi:sugar phosphate isomerase/epimerase